MLVGWLQSEQGIQVRLLEMREPYIYTLALSLKNRLRIHQLLHSFGLYCSFRLEFDDVAHRAPLPARL